MNLKKINLGLKHVGLLSLPILILLISFFIKSYFVENIKNYFNLIYLSKYVVSDEFVKYAYINIPEKKQKIRIASLVDLFPYSTKIYVQQRLQYLPSPKIKKQTIIYLTFIYIGENKKFAEINGELYTEGDKISPTIKIIRIERNKVLIEESGRKKWLQL